MFKFFRFIGAAVLIFVSAATSTYAQSNTVNVNGADLAYEKIGTGSPVLFLHGAITDMRVWGSYAEEISKDRTFIAYNQRYFGTADWPDDGENLQTLTHSEDLIGLIEALEIGPVNLVTHSYAGMVAAHAMLKRPELFRSVIHYEASIDGLLETMPGGATASREQSSNYSKVGAALRDGRLEDASLRFFEAVGKLKEGAVETLPDPLPTMFRDNGRTIPHFIKKASAGRVTCEDLSVLIMPTLAVQGQKTFTRYGMQADQIARCQSNAMTLVVPGGTHTFPVTNPDEFAKIIVAFLELVDFAQ
jgi:pimeloyl-ACP methyl ester carboxylesterase